MILREGKAEFDEESQSFISYLKSNSFPWYHFEATDKYTAMVHLVMLRSDKPIRGSQNSPHLAIAERIFLDICKKNNVTVKTIYRIAFNLTFADPSAHGDVHYDHSYPHKHFILYLNKFDGGNTYLFNKNLEISEIIIASENKFVFFDSCQHAQGFCKSQQHRLVMVVTFDGECNSAN